MKSVENDYRKRKKVISLVILVISVFLPSIAGYSYGADIILCPPASPALGEKGTIESFISDDGHFLGYIPASIKIGGRLPMFRAMDLPDLFDRRGNSTVTCVKNQGLCGSCWAFGTYGSLESVLLTMEWGNYDLAEENLKQCHGFVWDGCNGGNSEISTAYLSRLSGPVDEEEDPYHPTNTSCESSFTPQIWVTEARYLPKDQDVIKQAIYDHGAVFTSYYHSGSYYNALYRTYYYYGSAPANHGVAIVGWDDNKSTAAPDPGAWIIKNSWGTGFGESGFFYISYYDTQILSENVQWLGVRPYPQDVRMYLWDEHGMTCLVGNGSDVGWGANRFVPSESGILKEVAFFTNRMDTMAEIYIYDVFDGTNMKYLLGPKTVTATGCAGYFTIALDRPIVVTQGDDFIVAMRFETPDYEYPIPTEMAKDDVNGDPYVLPDIEPNVSYRSYDGVTWGETTSSGLECNVCIRAIVYPRESSCDFDVDQDRDVDGFDLANFATYFNPEKLADFAACYGRLDCLPCK